MRRAIAHGASGYIPKSVAVDVIVGAVLSVLDGDVWLPDTPVAPKPRCHPAKPKLPRVSPN